MLKLSLKNKFIILILLIFFIVSCWNNKIYAATRDWSAVWEEIQNQDFSEMGQIWTTQGSTRGDLLQMTEQDVLGLDEEDREAYLRIASKYASNNKNLKGHDTYGGTVSAMLSSFLKNIEIIENNKSEELTSEEKSLISNFKTIADTGIKEDIPEGETIDFETFLEMATTGELEDAVVNQGFHNGETWITLTPEQVEQVSAKLDGDIEASNEASEEIDNINKSEHTILDRKPIGLLPEQEGDGQITVDDTIDGAMDFVNRGDDIIVQDRLQETIGSLYNVLLVIAMVVAVVTGLIIAIKFMTSSVEGKAEVKKTLVPYVISCAVTFGAFGIWKLVVEILNNLE